VKEADALSEEGCDVRVVAGDYHPWGHDADAKFADRDWTVRRVPYGRMASFFRRGYLSARKRIAAFLSESIPRESPVLSLRAYHWAIPELARAALSVDADLYVAHNLPALPAAAFAARQHNSRLGFDAEDFHRGQFKEEEMESQKARLTRWIEDTYLPRCDYVTAASPGIGRAYASAVDVPEPTTILNVFACDERSGSTPASELRQEHPGDGISLYWYSQTIGPDRGLDVVVRAMGIVRARSDRSESHPLILSLRGSWARGFEEKLRGLAQSVGLSNNQIRHLPRTPPDHLVERATAHDLGLALEQTASRNRDICITNKIFTYLLAGLPVLATDTCGQRYVHDQVPDAVTLCPVGDANAMAAQLATFIQSPDIRSEAAEAARKAGEEEFNWDVEKERFLDVVRSVLDLQPHHD
jgi:glycosyltransferase involved in cell wall biosynthesis